MLPEAPWRYFIPTSKVQLLPLNKLKMTRARPEGIVEAARLMEQAYRGEVERRQPIQVRAEGDYYLVLDGNSTTAVARQNGWGKIAAEVEVGKASGTTPLDNLIPIR